MSNKSGNSIVAAIVLMISVVFFVGSIVYLTYINPLSFNPDSSPKIVTMSNKESIPEPTILNKTIEEAIKELKNEGCTFVSVKAPVYLSNPQYLNFDDFKLKTQETKTVIMSPSSSGIILVVQKEDIQWLWVPGN